MKIQEKTMIPLGYGKYFVSDSIIGLQPMEENRGPGQRTWVHIEGQSIPLTASRAEGSILAIWCKSRNRSPKTESRTACCRIFWNRSARCRRC